MVRKLMGDLRDEVRTLVPAIYSPTQEVRILYGCYNSASNVLEDCLMNIRGPTWPDLVNRILPALFRPRVRNVTPISI
jgi:hypothetical protein